MASPKARVPQPRAVCWGFARDKGEQCKKDARQPRRCDEQRGLSRFIVSETFVIQDPSAASLLGKSTKPGIYNAKLPKHFLVDSLHLSFIVTIKLSSTMITATTHPETTAAVLRRWQEILDDPRFNDPHQRIETDALGNVIMSPRPTGHHDQTCDWIRQVLKALPGNGAFGEHEVLTDKGVKISDVLWINPEHPWDKHSTKPLIPAPDICVEVRSPNNTIDSLIEKRDASSAPRIQGSLDF